MDGAFPALRSAPSRVRSGNAVLAYAAGLDIADLAPFVRSLRAVFSGQIILAVEHRPTLIAWLATHDVEAVIVSRPGLRKRPPGLARWPVFAQVLQSRPDLHHVLIVDIDSVVFQGDPFGDLPTNLQLVEAAGSAVSAPLFRDLVGDALAAKLGRSAPVLSDVIAGPAPAVVQFCTSMQRLSAASRGLPAGPRERERLVCTVIARLGFDGSRVVPNFGRVAIAGEQHRIVDGRITHPRAGASPVIQGYQRHACLADHVARRWGILPPRRPSPARGWREVVRLAQQVHRHALAIAWPAPQRVAAPTEVRRRRSSERIVAASSGSSGMAERAASESA